ncbi:MAG: DegT/DnrJ/EryC1/StrS family aminotransferase [Clostridia bacterium]|nr:DegT/DnrJ/EryC1/StrS family aminotransferase [Clostridia bacterium]
MEQLAMFGGEKAKTVPYSTGKRFDGNELKYLQEALEQNTLFYWSGSKVKEMNKKFAAMCGMEYCMATSSGTAAIHTALGAVGVTEGDEVITAPVTDMGSIIGILYQNAIPVFADIDPHTYNMDPKSIESKISDKTKAILVVHLAGNPADMDEIMAIAKKHNIKVVEDCAQSYMTYYKGQLVGTFGDIGCFSLNEFKHISAGDGGMCVTNDFALYEKALRFADKNYTRLEGGGTGRNISYIAPNYRMNELTGAVGLAQLERVEWICAQRRAYGDKLTEAIKNIKGLYPHEVREGNTSSYWFYMFRLDEDVLGVDTDTFVQALNAEGVPCGRGYTAHCVYEYDLFKNKSAYPGTHAPFDSPYYGKEIDYPSGLCPVAEEVLQTSIRISVNEFYSEQDLQETIHAIEKVANYYLSQK